MEKIIGGQLAAEALVDQGVDKIFTISGGHITPIYQFLENTDVELFDTRHEQAAVYMAEAYGRLKRKPGVAMVTAGPGFTNALSAIANAQLTNAPLVLIAGQAGLSSREKLDLQDMQQMPVIESLVKKAFIASNPERIPEIIDMAFRTASSGRPGPVYVELPVDVLNAEAVPEKIKKIKTVVDSKPVDYAGAAKMIEMIKEAEKPIVIGGSGVWFSDASDELVEFVEKTGMPAFTSTQGRGAIPDTHPLCFEGSLAIRPGAAIFANMNADLVIVLGNRLSLYYIFGDIFKKDAKMIQVDISPEELGRNRQIDLPIFSDIKGLLKECNRLIDEKGLSDTFKPKFAEWVEALKKPEEESKSLSRLNSESDNIPMHPQRLANEVNKFMDREDDIVIADGGDTQCWMGMMRTCLKPGHYMDSGLYGCLAVGLPYANAAKVLFPEKRVLLIIGDGSVGFNFMEFEIAIRKNIPIVVVISNDLGWGMIRHSQQIRLGHAIEAGTHIGEVRYDKVVEALGGKGMYVEKIEDIQPALEEAFASGKTTCINVMVDPSTISPGSVALANLGGYSAG